MTLFWYDFAMKPLRTLVQSLCLAVAFVLCRLNYACALDELKANQFAVSAGYFMPKENALQGGWSVGLRYIPVETGKAQASFGVYFSSPSLKTTKQSVQHRDYFINYTMQLGALKTQKKLIPFLGTGIDYVDIPESGVAPHESAGFNIHTGMRFGNHLTLETRFLVSRKGNLNRGGWGGGLIYRF